MNISFGEILIIALVALLFYRPSEIRGFVSSIFRMKKDIESDINTITSGVKEKVEFFEHEPLNGEKAVNFQKKEQ